MLTLFKLDSIQTHTVGSILSGYHMSWQRAPESEKLVPN